MDSMQENEFEKVVQQKMEVFKLNPSDKKNIFHGVILLPRGIWPVKKLVNELRSLPPSVTIKIDPDSLL